ncbi:3-hydroxybutyryl-CoA dehydrogenase [Cyclobacteriaceae bacterium]|jgi:3-hydroxybutyryl-CoA dehydrogenase|nr:3-hydroxybutyryl-CoA dehydrogenase [Cyclobacteriaceae bacterium]|tara:strand:- start:909 stop:1805 length:897 start_codon:yes stop_codon:yes gene_type:complete
MKNINQVSIIGAGTMGNGIAHVFAQFGFKVALIDIDEDRLKNGLKNIEKNIDRQILKHQLEDSEKALILSRIAPFNNIKNGVVSADLVIEAATENYEVKKNIFQEIDNYAPKDAILASNTSSISITKIAAETQRPSLVIGMHFMNPVPIMKLVEVIKGYATSQETVTSIIETVAHLEKMAVEVKDYPGFTANRILLPMINEAIFTLFEGVAGVSDIDTVMKLGMAHPMGPLQLADFIGLDVCLSVMQVLQEGIGDDKYRPCPLLVNMVNAGYLGKKTGEGFYKYEHNSKDFTVSKQFE